MLASPFFDPNKKKEITQENPSSVDGFLSKYLLKHFNKIKLLSSDILKLPGEEEIFFLHTENSFNAFTFIPLVAKAQSIKELYASTYSINIRVIESLMELHDAGLIEKITLLVSDSLIKRNPTTNDLLKSMAASRPNVQVQYSWNHSKVCLMETECNYYILEGSGNWSENALIEQYIFVNSKDTYEFRKTLFTQAKLK